jgi:hypothetical protein
LTSEKIRQGKYSDRGENQGEGILARLENSRGENISYWGIFDDLKIHAL